MIVGISPAFSEYEHVNEYQSPNHHDILIFTGQGFMERDIINIRSCDAVVIIFLGVAEQKKKTNTHHPQGATYDPTHKQ